MELQITATPRETLVWASDAREARTLRHELISAGHLVLDADPSELELLGRIPAGEPAEFDPARIINVEIGADANASLQALVDVGHSLVWHRWQLHPDETLWGVPVATPDPPRVVKSATGSTAAAVNLGVTVRSTRGLGLRMTREVYARISKRSSTPFSREDYPRLWDALNDNYEDADHRIYTDEWCANYQKLALENYDLNMRFFASLDHDEFDQALQRAVKSQPGMREVTDLAEWDGVPGLYIMVLDEYCQAYVGAASSTGGIMRRIKQHWTRSQPFDRLLWGGVTESILAIDSFRALDTTRLFATKTTGAFEGENPLIDQFPPKFLLNRLRGGNDAVRFAALLGVSSVMKTRDLRTADTSRLS